MQAYLVPLQLCPLLPFCSCTCKLLVNQPFTCLLGDSPVGELAVCDVPAVVRIEVCV